MTQELLDNEIVTELDIGHLAIEDDTPVDDFQSKVQQRLLVEPLYSSQALTAPFLAAANIGLFYKLKGEPFSAERNCEALVPDVMLSLGVQRCDALKYNCITLNHIDLMLNCRGKLNMNYCKR
jgi:hypothetical protein